MARNDSIANGAESAVSLQLVLVRPGCTEFDEQGRMKGSLDIPLCEHGSRQAEQTAQQLADLALSVVHSAPCSSARQTAQAIAASQRLKVKLLDDLHNVDHGLWHGKRIDEVRQTQPRVYRQGQDHANSICPPQGEPIAAGRERVTRALAKLLKKQRTGLICLVVPEPLASVVDSQLRQVELADLWERECDDGGWTLYNLIPDATAELGVRVHSLKSGEPVELVAKRA